MPSLAGRNITHPGLASKGADELEMKLLDDKEAEENRKENHAWMMAGCIPKRDRELVERAFDIVQQDILHSSGANGEVEDMLVGPALPWAFFANGMTWGSFVLITVVGTQLVEVDEYGLAQQPQGVWLVAIILLWFGITCVTLYPEFQAAMFCLPSQSVCVKRRKGWVPFNSWIFRMMVLSFILHTDIYTTSIFVARVWKSTMHCDELNSLWAASIQSSFFKEVPIIRSLSYLQLVFSISCVMIAQLVYALCYSWPTSPNLTHGLPISDERVKYQIVESRATCELYNTLFKKDTGHGRSLQALSESGRMSSLNWQDDLYLEQAEMSWSANRVHDEMRRTNIRFILFCLQATMVPILQITFLGIQKAHRLHEQNLEGRHSGSSDQLTVGSFLISVISGLHYIWYELKAMNTHKKYVRRAIREQNENARHLNDNRKHWDAVQLSRLAEFSIVANLLVALGFMGTFCFIIVKAYMALIVCETGIWNVHFDPNLRELSLGLASGCVNTHAIAHYRPMCGTGFANVTANATASLVLAALR